MKTPQFPTPVYYVRGCNTLETLEKPPVPSNGEIRASITRRKRIEQLWFTSLDNDWGADPESWPSPWRENYRKLLERQAEYESLYS